MRHIYCILLRLSFLYLVLSQRESNSRYHRLFNGHDFHNHTSVRWRDNKYVNNDLGKNDDKLLTNITTESILPYQRCHANQFYPGPKKISSIFSHNSKDYKIVLTSISTWGRSDLATGRPVSVSKFEVLSFFYEHNVACTVGHCFSSVFPSNNLPSVSCSLHINKTDIFVMNGSMEFAPDLGIKEKEIPVGYIPSMTIECHIPCPMCRNLDIFLYDNFNLEIAINEKHVGDLDICYEHVEEPEDIVVCTQPAFQNQHNNSDSSTKDPFWYGGPPYIGYNLLDQFIVYHSILQRARVVFNDLTNDTAMLIRKYSNNKKVVYRDEWNMTDIFITDKTLKYAYETLAETSCVFENRFRSKWFIIAHAVDNFVLPMIENVTLAQLVRDFDPGLFYIVSVPMILPHTTNPPRKDGNILLRWPLLGKEFQWGDKDLRHTPLGNPRKVSYTFVHWLAVYRKYWSPERNYSHRQAVELLKLHTVHVMGAGEPACNEHKGNRHKVYDAIAQRLEEALLLKSI